MTNGGIFGPKLSGKTTLAKALSAEYWRKLRIQSLVLDPNLESWQQPACVTADEKLFWQTVWSKRNCLIIVDESTETINRDKELIPVFTRLRHQSHKLLVIGHSGMNLLPIMREQIDTIYLFRQSLAAAKTWQELFTQDCLLEATQLNQFEFIHTTLYGKCSKLKLKLKL